MNIVHDVDGRIYFKHLASIDPNYYHARPLRVFFRSLLRFDWNDLILSVRSFYFIVLGQWFDKRPIIICVAPFSYRLIFYLPSILLNEKSFYQSSWPYWNGPNTVPFDYCGFKKGVRLMWKYLLGISTIELIGVTDVVKEEISKFLGGKIVHVIPHSINLVNYTMKPEIVNSIRVIGFIGRLTEEKGISEFLSFASKNRQFRYIICGDGELKRDVLSSEIIEYWGYVDKQEKEKFYKEIDFLFVPSKRSRVWEELFGVVIIEAMSFGVIVIATDHTGPKSIIKENFNGFIVDERLFISSAEKIVNTISGSEISRIRHNSYRASIKYSAENVKEKWLELL